MAAFLQQSRGLEPSEAISAQAHYVIAAVYALLTITAITLNTPVLVTFIRDHTLRTPSNKLILSITGGDWLHAVLVFPIGVVANARNRSLALTGTGCTWYAFITVFLSFGVILHHAAFAIERAVVLKCAITSSILGKNITAVIIALWCFAFIWSCFPLFGWSAYVPGGGQTFCTIYWQSSQSLDIAFIGCIFLLFFVAPIVTMVTAYSTIYRSVKNMTKRAHGVWGKDAVPTQETIRAESKSAHMAFIMSFCFLFAWTPYAVVSLQAVITKPKGISPLVAALPALFAKTATCFNPIVYFFKFKKLRKSVKKTMRTLCVHFIKQEKVSRPLS